ncbi:uncharacterized protein PGTG_09663 [Puccinia graminis f. sp. tritici CRL 75-36-700-3]|uniref:Uncharacterized protein n=1 Tax=Puccinia graminis f. sp. tritici (strain CRL 75-36-700-3 / race SCCL) TaxID=418459 RepID=E3KI25_PUCGT|nr:uncharacterized protein PGTG_09663 [Puccinia graminis f. sp. tritici CRL 75-36-700-3]EFP83950.2 hypothetical protein PGTG_09663 [Puccinia graminis f. sp. tritici CRL 75-36-700-3]
MISLISTCFLLANAVASLATSSETNVKIVSPAPGASLHLGASLDVVLQIEKDSMKTSQQVLLGLGMNSEDSQHPTSLGEVFLGLLNTTQTPFSAEGKLTWSVSIPAREKMNSTATSFFLVVSQYMFSGPSHTPHCGLVSVPVKVTGPSASVPGVGGKAHGSSSTGCAPGSSSCATGSSPSSETPKDPSSSKPGSAASPATMNMTSSIDKPASGEPKANLTKTEIKKTIIAQGHNTGATIPGAPSKDSLPGQPAPTTPSSSTPASSNTTSTESSPAQKTGSVSPSAKTNGTNPPPESESAAAHLGLSSSHLIAAVAVVAGIFASV